MKAAARREAAMRLQVQANHNIQQAPLMLEACEVENQVSSVRAHFAPHQDGISMQTLELGRGRGQGHGRVGRSRGRQGGVRRHKWIDQGAGVVYDQGHVDSDTRRGRGRGLGRGQGRGPQMGRRADCLPPLGWIPPPIIPNDVTPPRLRSLHGRSVQHLPPMRSADNIEVHTNQGTDVAMDPRSLAMEESRFTNTRRVRVNLDSEFAGTQQTETWLPTITELAKGVAFLGVNQGKYHTTEGTSTKTAATGETLIQCIPGGPNKADGRSYPEEVWVQLIVLGYDPQQYGGLQHFVGEVQQAYWEEERHLFSIDFGGGIGLKIVNCLNCLTRDWHDPCTAAQGRWRQAIHSPQHGSVDATIQGLQNEESIGFDAVGMTGINRNVRSGDDSNSSDSDDQLWMGDFADYAAHGSNDENSDWDLFDDRSDRLSEASGAFDFDEYQRFAEVDVDNPRSVEGIRERYSDAHWGQHATDMLGDRNRFTGLYPWPTQRFTRNKMKASSFFRLFWDNDIVDKMVHQTNLYAAQVVTKYQSEYKNGGPKWVQLTQIEFRAWLGVVILMALKQTPTIRDYWKKGSFWHCPIIANVMARDRFECILRCLHFVDNETLPKKGEPGYDKIGKVRPLLDGFVQRSRRLWNPEHVVTCDEIMIAYRGHFSPIRQYIPAKPTRYGIKMWALVSNPSRYIYNLIPYLGKNGATEIGQGEHVVSQLVRGMSHKGHIVVMDNFFTSPSLFDSLLNRGIYATGTVKGNRVGVPSSLTGFCRGQHPRNTLFWAMHDSQRMSACTWYDSKPVSFLSTSKNPCHDGVAFAQRWLNGVRTAQATSPQQVEYKHNMRGVDVVDQMRRDYTCQFWSRKWWHKVWFFIFDSSLQNAWRLYKDDRQARKERLSGRKAFHFTVAMELIEPFFPLPRTCSPYNAHNMEVHHSVRSRNRWPRQCKCCKRKQRRVCRTCGPVGEPTWLCDEPCFLKVHSSRKWAMRLAH